VAEGKVEPNISATGSGELSISFGVKSDADLKEEQRKINVAKNKLVETTRKNWKELLEESKKERSTSCLLKEVMPCAFCAPL
jgi:hypothetical protein